MPIKSQNRQHPSKFLKGHASLTFCIHHNEDATGRAIMKAFQDVTRDVLYGAEKGISGMEGEYVPSL